MTSQTAFTFLVYPALILAYMGQAAYLSQHHHSGYKISFYLSVPGMPFCGFSVERIREGEKQPTVI